MFLVLQKLALRGRTLKDSPRFGLSRGGWGRSRGDWPLGRAIRRWLRRPLSYPTMLVAIVPLWTAWPTDFANPICRAAVFQEIPGRGSGHAPDSLAEDRVADDLADRVRTWIEQLDAPLRSQRDAAEQALREGGPSLLELLPPAEEASSAERRLRLERIWQSLAAAAVEQALRGSTIELAGDGASASEILRRIRQQSGIRLQWAVADAPGAVSSDRLSGPFWPVLDGLLDTWHADLQAAEEPFALRIVPRSPERPARLGTANYSGAFRLQPTRFRRYAESDGTVTLRIGLSVEWEPTLWPVVVWQDPVWNRVTTVSGGEATPRSGGRREIPLPRMVYPLPLTTEFSLPAGDADIRRWTGRIEVLAAAVPHSFAFDLRAGIPSRRSLGDVTVELERLETSDTSVIATLRVEYRNVEVPLKSHLAGVFENPVRLEYPDGTICAGVIRETTAETDRSAVIRYVFRKPETSPPHSPPDRLAATIPLAVRTVAVDYDFGGDQLSPSAGPPSLEDSPP